MSCFETASGTLGLTRVRDEAAWVSTCQSPDSSGSPSTCWAYLSLELIWLSQASCSGDLSDKSLIFLITLHLHPMSSRTAMAAECACYQPPKPRLAGDRWQGLHGVIPWKIWAPFRAYIELLNGSYPGESPEPTYFIFFCLNQPQDAYGWPSIPAKSPRGLWMHALKTSF